MTYIIGAGSRGPSGENPEWTTGAQGLVLPSGFVASLSAGQRDQLNLNTILDAQCTLEARFDAALALRSPEIAAAVRQRILELSQSSLDHSDCQADLIVASLTAIALKGEVESNPALLDFALHEAHLPNDHAVGTEDRRFRAIKLLQHANCLEAVEALATIVDDAERSTFIRKAALHGLLGIKLEQCGEALLRLINREPRTDLFLRDSEQEMEAAGSPVITLAQFATGDFGKAQANLALKFEENLVLEVIKLCAIFRPDNRALGQSLLLISQDESDSALQMAALATLTPKFSEFRSAESLKFIDHLDGEKFKEEHFLDDLQNKRKLKAARNGG